MCLHLHHLAWASGVAETQPNLYPLKSASGSFSHSPTSLPGLTSQHVWIPWAQSKPPQNLLGRKKPRHEAGMQSTTIKSLQSSHIERCHKRVRDAATRRQSLAGLSKRSWPEVHTCNLKLLTGPAKKTLPSPCCRRKISSGPWRARAALVFQIWDIMCLSEPLIYDPKAVKHIMYT